MSYRAPTFTLTDPPPPKPGLAAAWERLFAARGITAHLLDVVGAGVRVAVWSPAEGTATLEAPSRPGAYWRAAWEPARGARRECRRARCEDVVAWLMEAIREEAPPAPPPVRPTSAAPRSPDPGAPFLPLDVAYEEYRRAGVGRMAPEGCAATPRPVPSDAFLPLDIAYETQRNARRPDPIRSR